MATYRGNCGGFNGASCAPTSAPLPPLSLNDKADIIKQTVLRCVGGELNGVATARLVADSVEPTVERGGRYGQGLCSLRCGAPAHQSTKRIEFFGSESKPIRFHLDSPSATICDIANEPSHGTSECRRHPTAAIRSVAGERVQFIFANHSIGPDKP